MTERVLDSPHCLLPVDIHAFRGVTKNIDFDVYLKLSDDNVVRVFSRATGIDYKRLAQYTQKGVQQLFIHPDDLEAFKRSLSRPARDIFLDPATTQEKRIASLLNMTEQNMAELFTQISVENETAVASRQLIKSYVSLMTRTPETLNIILKLVAHGEYLYYHSIAVAIFSMLIARASGQFNQRMLEIVAMGGFLHDIGCTQISRELMSSPSKLDEQQWEEMQSHSKLGLQMIETTPLIPEEVKYIVYQHHEQPGGQGYPNGLRNPVIYYPAKIVALADAFSALIIDRPFRKAYTVPAALAILQSEIGKYDRDLVQLMVTVFERRAPTRKSA